MFENRSEQERKKILWLFVISITLVVFVVWLILFAKGYVLRTKKLAEINNQNTSQTDLGKIRGELKSTINEFNKLDIKQKLSDIKDEFSNINQNQNQAVNISENINQPEVNEPTQLDEVSEQNNLENLNNSSIPRLPVE